MNRVLNLQRLALDTNTGTMGYSSGSSTHTCCGAGSVDR